MLKNKILILAIGKSKLKLAQRLKNNLSGNSKGVFIITDQNILDGNLSEIRLFKDYENTFSDTYFNVFYKAQDLIHCIEKININNQFIFKELSYYQSISLWEMSRSYLLSELIPFLKELSTVCKIVESEIPSGVCILGNSKRLERIFEVVCARKEIPVHFYNTVPAYKILIKDIIKNNKYFIRKIWRFFKTSYFGLFNYFVSRKYKKYADSGMVIFFNYVERNLDAILPIIQKYSPNERLVINMPNSCCEKRLRKEDISYKHFYGYKTYDIFNQEISEFLNNIWNVVNNDSSFQSQLRYEGIMLWPVLKDTFWNLTFRVFPENIYNAKAVNKIVSSHKTKAVVVVDYSCEAMAAKSLSIPVLSITPSSPDELRYYGVVISDYVTVTGSGWKDTLIKLGFLPEQIVVSGPTKFDLVLKERFEREKVLEELNLDRKNKTIVYAGSYICESMGFDYDSYVKEIRMVFRSLSKIKGVNLITKLHPYESNFTLYRKIAKEENCENMAILRDFNIWKLISCCDLIINNSSTVSYEATVMDKIVILLCYTNKYFFCDIWNLEKTKSAIFVYDFSELGEKIKDALFDFKTQEILRANRKRYIMDYAWPLDGKASCRVKDLIETISLKHGKDEHTLCSSLVG